jgi:serine/threonine-protein kinase
LEVRGVAVPVVPRLVTTASGAGDFALATDGTLVYADAPSGFVNNARTLVWVDRAGKEEPIPAPPRAYIYPRLSPDGMRVALDIRDQENDLWMWDLQRATLTRLTFDPGADQWPVWTPDGRRLVFASDRVGGELNLWWQAVDGTGAAEQLTTSRNRQLPSGTSPDGTQVIFSEYGPTTGSDLMRLPLNDARPPTVSTRGREMPVLQTKFLESDGIISPDGRWLAYESDSSGRREIYVRPFPTTGAGQWQVSTAGGTQPLWARSGTELFFLGLDNALMRVSVETTGATWNAGTPAKLLDGNYFQPGGARPYDVSPDGQRFLMIKARGSDAAAAPQLIVVQHWDEELKRLVPAK